MITERQLKRVNDLKSYKWRLERILDDFDSTHVRNKIGLVKYSQNTSKKYDSLHIRVEEEQNNNFQFLLSDAISDAQKLITDRIKEEIHFIDEELKLYIGESNE